MVFALDQARGIFPKRLIPLKVSDILLVASLSCLLSLGTLLSHTQWSPIWTKFHVTCHCSWANSEIRYVSPTSSNIYDHGHQSLLASFLYMRLQSYEQKLANRPIDGKDTTLGLHQCSTISILVSPYHWRSYQFVGQNRQQECTTEVAVEEIPSVFPYLFEPRGDLKHKQRRDGQQL